MEIREISRCRACGGAALEGILDLGEQVLTGRFEHPEAPQPPAGPLHLVRCDAARGGCGLVQLAHDYRGEDLYGPGYGYRSSITRSMVQHLTAKTAALLALVRPQPGEAVLDIGCNDGTLLRTYDVRGLRRVGIDPSSEQFRAGFPAGVELIVDFFSAARVREACGDVRFRIITSIAMFYDIADPLQFMRDVKSLLAEDGIWEMEQAYLPSTVSQLCYDAICHEHLTYYALHQIAWLAERAGLRIVDAGTNDVNGGSFRVVLAHATGVRAQSAAAATLLEREKRGGYLQRTPYDAFASHVQRHREVVRRFFHDVRTQGKRALGYGASTKGNVLLQYCGVTAGDLPAILERDPRKFGLVAPGTRIPIISEAEGHARKPAYLFVLPWHFRDEMIPREQAYLAAGGRLVFPLPRFEIVGEGGKVIETREPA